MQSVFFPYGRKCTPMSMDNGLLRNTTKVGVVRLDWLAIE